jgi:hypothetical protein
LKLFGEEAKQTGKVVFSENFNVFRRKCEQNGLFREENIFMNKVVS